MTSSDRNGTRKVAFNKKAPTSDNYQGMEHTTGIGCSTLEIQRFSLPRKQGGKVIFTKCSHAIANHISPEAAWVFGVIEFWSAANARKKKSQTLKNGIYCCYLSWGDWKQELPFISERTIQRCVEQLKASGVIVAFKGDAVSGRANYYAVDHKGWLKFQAWSSGQVLSAEDGRALTPKGEQVEDADQEELIAGYPRQPDDIEEPILVTQTIDPRQPDEDILVTVTKMPHTLDIERSNRELTESIVCAVGRTDHTTRPKKAKTVSDGSLIFEAYKEAYAKRYSQEPLRNAKVNSICSQIAKEVGIEVGKAIMHFYLQQNVAWYVQKAHAIQFALADLQALRTNMLNNQAMSSRQAQLVDKQQSQKNALENYLANREKYAFK